MQTLNESDTMEMVVPARGGRSRGRAVPVAASRRGRRGVTSRGGRRVSPAAARVGGAAGGTRGKAKLVQMVRRKLSDWGRSLRGMLAPRHLGKAGWLFVVGLGWFSAHVMIELLAHLILGMPVFV